MITRTPRFISLGMTLGLVFTLLFSTLLWPRAEARAKIINAPVFAALTPAQLQALENELRALEFDIANRFTEVTQNFPFPSENPYDSNATLDELTSRLAELKAKFEASMMPIPVDLTNALKDMESKLEIVRVILQGGEGGQETRNLRTHGKSVNAAHAGKPARPPARNSSRAHANAAPMMPMPAPGQITGQVRNAATLANIQNVAVIIHDQSGTLLGIAGTNASGLYTFPAVPPGTYYMSTIAYHVGFLNQIYGGGDVIFPDRTNSTAGAPVVVNDGATTSGVNFFLTPGGKITGTVTDSATNLPAASPVLVSAVSLGGQGELLWSDTTNVSGAYEIPALPSGIYYIFTTNVTRHINEVYNGIQCNSYAPCREIATTGTPIIVTAGATTSGINFQLDKGTAVVSGNVKDAGTAANLPSVAVTIHDSLGRMVAFDFTDGSGNYDAGEFLGGLVPGTYFAVTDNVQNYVNGRYNGGICVGNLANLGPLTVITTCDPTLGTPINVPAAGVTGINFQLNKGGSIRGSVKDYATVSPLFAIRVRIYDSSGNLVYTTFSGAGGAGIYDTSLFPARGLPTGTYFVRTDNTQGYIDVRFNGGACDPPTCVPTTGTPVSVTAPNQTAGVNFLLQKSDIRGSITDYNTGARLGAIEVRFFNSSGQFVTSGLSASPFFSPAPGVYNTEKGFLSGSYFAITKNQSGFIDALYNGALCVGGSCNPLLGTPINMMAGVPRAGVSFLLQKGARIRGKVTDGVTGLPVSNVAVLVFDANTGQQVATGTTDATGVYNTESGLPAGQYRVRAVGPAGFGSQAYFGFTCPCGPMTGTVVNVPAGAVVAGINMVLPRTP